jgi:hypothetical protein
VFRWSPGAFSFLNSFFFVFFFRVKAVAVLFVCAVSLFSSVSSFFFLMACAKPIRITEPPQKRVSFVPYSTHSLTREKVMWDDVRERGRDEGKQSGWLFSLYDCAGECCAGLLHCSPSRGGEKSPFNGVQNATLIEALRLFLSTDMSVCVSMCGCICVYVCEVLLPPLFSKKKRVGDLTAKLSESLAGYLCVCLSSCFLFRVFSVFFFRLLRCTLLFSLVIH